MIAIVAHGLEDFAQALVVANVVADEVGDAHDATPPQARRGRNVVLTRRKEDRQLDART